MHEEERNDRTKLSESESLRNDMRRLAESRHNPFMKNGKIDVDAYIEFLNVYNVFSNALNSTVLSHHLNHQDLPLE